MMILTEGMNLEDVPAVVDRMGAEAETVDRAAEAPEMAVRMVVGQADGDRIHGDQAVVHRQTWSNGTSRTTGTTGISRIPGAPG